MKYEHNEFPSDIFVILEAVNATVTIGIFLNDFIQIITIYL